MNGDLREIVDHLHRLDADAVVVASLILDRAKAGYSIGGPLHHVLNHLHDLHNTLHAGHALKDLTSALPPAPEPELTPTTVEPIAEAPVVQPKRRRDC